MKYTIAAQPHPSPAARPRDKRQWIADAVDRYEVPLIRFAARMLGDVDRARDVVQDTFMKLWEADQPEIEGHLSQWLYRVCRNRALDVHKKETRMKTLADPELMPRAGNDQEQAHEASTRGVLAVLDALPERQQEVIRLKFQGGLSYREIAHVMNLTVNHVGVLIHTGLKTIRERINPTANTLPPISGAERGH